MNSQAVDTARRLYERDDLTWSIRPGSDDRIGPGPHEDGMHGKLQHIVSANEVFVDAGAHVGHYTLRMARHGATVIAIEPNPEAREALFTNINLNSLTNVKVHGVAAHSRTDTLRLWDPFNVIAGSCTRTVPQTEGCPLPAGYGISTLFVGRNGVGEYLGQTAALPIDVLTSALEDRVALIKMDVEGNEGNALAGAHRTISRDQPAVIIEMHDSMYGGRIRDAVLEQLSSLDYRWQSLTLDQQSVVTTSRVCEFIYAEPRSREFTDIFSDW